MAYRRQIGRDLLNVPMGEMIRQMAFAIAEAQLELDESGIRQAELMSGHVALRDDDGNLLLDAEGNARFRPSTVSFGFREEGGALKPEEVSMMELGFTPTFYQFVDTLIDVKIAITMTEETSNESRTKGHRISHTINKYGSFYSRRVSVTPVDAKYSQKYSYSAEGSSQLRTKLVPVPPPAILEERARAMLELYLEHQAQTNGDSNTNPV